MHSAAWPYILLLLLSAGLSAVLAVLAWQRRPAPGAASGSWLLWALCEWCLTYALALGSPDAWWAGFWSRLRFAGIAAAPVAWLSLALRYTGRPAPISVRSLAIILIVPAVTQILSWDSRSALMFGAPVADAPPPFYGVVLTPGPWYWVHTGYSYLLLLVGIVVLLAWLARTREHYQGQVTLIAVAVLVPWAGNVVTQLGIAPNPHLDLTPFCFVLSAVAVFVAMFRYRFLNLVPVARDAVVEGMSDGIIVVDWQDRVVDLNPAARQVLKCTSGEAVGRPIGEFLGVWSQLAPKLPFLPQAHGELSARIGGVERSFDVSVSSLGERSGRLQGRLVVLHDITDLKATQQSLQRNEQRYRTLFETSSDAILMAGVDGRVIDCNHSACIQYGCTRETLLGLPVSDLVGSGEDGAMGAFGHASASEEGVFVTTYGRRRDGGTFPAEVRTQLVQVGEEPCAVTFVRDITDRKQAESMWQWRDTLLRSVADNSPLAFYVVDDRDDRVLYANQQFCDLWGLPALQVGLQQGEGLAGEEVGAALQRQVADPGGFDQQWTRLRGEIPRTVVEQDLALADGRTLRWFSAQVRDSHGRYFGRLHIFEDTSDRKRAEDAQRLAAVGQLAAGVAHEFNNILCSMRLRADLAHYRQAPGEYEELVRVVLEGAQKGAQICDDMLSFARPTRPARVMAPIERPLETALSLAESRLTAGKVTVRRQYDTDGWLVSIDTAQIEHVFLNLILNACDAMSDGGLLTLTTSYDPLAGGQVVVELGDTGCGIRPEHLPRLFEPFFTTKGRLGESDIPGTGLGLAVSHGLLKAHHASISVRSEWGQGTVFEVRFEAYAAEAQVSAADPPAMAVGSAESLGRVLVAEDEAEVRATVEEALESQGYRVVTVGTVPEATAVLETEDFELVVTDLLMPGGDGRAVVQAACRSAANPPVLVITGNAAPALDHELRRVGAAHWIAKPFGLAELLQAVETVLCGARLAHRD